MLEGAHTKSCAGLICRAPRKGELGQSEMHALVDRLLLVHRPVHLKRYLECLCNMLQSAMQSYPVLLVTCRTERTGLWAQARSPLSPFLQKVHSSYQCNVYGIKYIPVTRCSLYTAFYCSLKQKQHEPTHYYYMQFFSL